MMVHDGEGMHSILDDVNDMVKSCDLSPADTFMVDMRDFMQTNEALLAGKSRDQVLAMVLQWHKQRGDSPSFLIVNPSSNQPITSFDTLRLVYLYTNRGGIADPAAPQGQVLVDWNSGVARFATGTSSVLFDTDGGTKATLIPTSRTDLAALLAKDVSSWSQSSGYRVPDDWLESGFSEWTLVICADDFSVHRYDGSGSSKAPPGSATSWRVSSR